MKNSTNHPFTSLHAKYKKGMLVFALLTIGLLCSFTTLKGQGKVTGTITDAETYKPIEAATVELLKVQDSSLVEGIITNADGEYNFEKVPWGGYVLRVSFLGYHQKFVDAFGVVPNKPHVQFGKTALLSDKKNIEEVSVYARMLTGTIEDDKIIYVINEKAAELAQSGLELLRQVPDCQVDFMTNEVTLEGLSNILYQVNGKRVEREYLMQLNPKIIDKYEITTNPGVKYDANVDAVINVVLKKDLDYGMSLRAAAELPTSQTFFTNSNASIDFFRKGLRVFAGGNFGAQQWDLNFDNNRYSDGNKTLLLLEQKMVSEGNYNMYSGLNYGFDWFINDKNILNFYSSINPRLRTQNSYITDVFNGFDTATVYAPGISPDTIETNYSINKFDENNNRFYNDYSLFYKYNINDEGHEISAEIFFSYNNQDEDKSYTDSYIFENYNNQKEMYSEIRQITDDTKNIYRGKVDYNNPLTKALKLSTGLSGEFSRMYNEYQRDTFGVFAFKNTIEYDELRSAAYLNLAYKVKKTNFQAGLRYEYSDVDIRYKGTDTTNTYGRLLPFISAQTNLGKKHTLRLNYRRSIRRPGLNQIDPFEYKDDQYNTSFGNPNLNPADVHRFEFAHRINIMGPLFVNYKPYVRIVNGDIAKVTTDLDNGVAINEFQNVSNLLEYGASVNANVAFVKWWMINPSFTYLRRNIEDKPELGINGIEKNSWRLNLNSQFILPKDWVIFVNFNKRSTDINYQTERDQNYVFVTGFWKKINQNWNVTAFTLNPWLNRFEFERVKKTPTAYYQENLGYVNYSHVFNVRIQYSFNVGKEIKKVNRKFDKDEDAQQGGGNMFGN